MICAVIRVSTRSSPLPKPPADRDTNSTNWHELPE
jgi:hypothetical protein